MEHLKLCCVAPHPPILVPEIGGAEVKRIQASVQAMEKLAGEIKDLKPDTLVVMSPHTPIFRDAFSVKSSKHLSGSFSQFGAPRVEIQSEPDFELVEAILRSAEPMDIPVVKDEGRSIRGDGGELDHGILVPLYYLAPPAFALVCLSMSLLDYRAHYRLGIAIRQAVEEVGHSTVFIASGDLSHRLKPGAPAGYSPRGEEFDRRVVDIMKSGDFKELFDLDPTMVDDAGECGLRSIITLAGTVDGHRAQSEVLSYEGPFGVGYMVSRVKPGEPDSSRRTLAL